MARGMLRRDSTSEQTRNYTGSVSIVARLDFEIKADSLDKAKEKLLSSSSSFNLEDEDGNNIKILAQDWDFALDDYSDISVPHLYNLEIQEER
ncbi:hypothetical protein [Clostridium sp.]|uniref:hypothetical protein n=1 Tax=Clostridium sp. TaxID=1506 RepID=UPI001B53BCC0|nr:hypothetical protein [Clostridium sp.]MBP3917350.1 hypothetical protein [Clostridium sp.]